MLRGVMARASEDNARIELVHLETGKVVQELVLTQAKDSFRSFIISTWLKSYKGLARKQGIERMYAESEPAIAESRWSDCTVATDSDGYTVYGWVCGGGGRLYHAYVIPELRRIGVFRAITGVAVGPVEYAARPFPFANASGVGRVNPYLLHPRAVSVVQRSGDGPNAPVDAELPQAVPQRGLV